MKIISVKNLEFPEVKVIRFGRFLDSRGYFGETFRQGIIDSTQDLEFLKGVKFSQVNESYSRPNTVRGLHFQWEPVMGKLVRTVFGQMADIVLDIRKNSPTFGKALLYNMPQDLANDYSEWIWVPPGFAHGNVYFKESLIEYFCSGEYAPKTEAGISPLAKDIDWSLADKDLRGKFEQIIGSSQILISDKDKSGLSVKDWSADGRSQNFIYG